MQHLRGVISLTNDIGSEGKISSANRADIAPAGIVADTGAVPVDFHVYVPAPAAVDKPFKQTACV